nr:hypothetical protein [Nostoc sp. ChiSLP03a]
MALTIQADALALHGIAFHEFFLLSDFSQQKFRSQKKCRILTSDS